MTSKKLTFSFTLLMCATSLGLVLMNRMATSASANSLMQQQAQSDQPVEKTRKNIQVLKGLPESQLFPLMNFVSTSLGVKCDYCHVKNGDNWVWESDDKDAKQSGRYMMKMVLEINKTNFDRDTAVTCFTCHRGSTVVARLPSLPPHDSVRNEAALPTADQVLAKYFAAVGGKDVAAKLKTTVMKGTLEFDRDPKERNGQIEVTVKEPGKYLITRTTPQGLATLTVNGEAAWIKTGNGSRNLSGHDLELTRRGAVAFYSPIKVVDQPAQMKVLGTEKIGDRETYVLALVIDPDTTTKFFFDTQTGLLLRQLTTTRTMLAPLPEQVDFEDYKDVDGVKLPFTIRSSDTATYSTTTRKFTEIKHNVAVDDNLFTAAPR
jgi:outer membrane lipoprotein-sorting protein